MIPENVAKFRPGACTEIKNIGGNYYVYMYESVLLESGKWGKKTGKSIEKIIPDTGFIPNRNYHLYEREGGKDDITILEYGQYALIEAVLNPNYTSDARADWAVFSSKGCCGKCEFLELHNCIGYCSKSNR